ncbi:flagellar biosynthetic protein FliR [Legionella nagasakiensis]|uniref:flagellar biosynthetic protein FliR n=1 Tax=Legionella nagasakiensis TaxID=535290 RepID=UPI0010554D96|nr:flagellar biosynthetic protein FliR [Legionella nagasakiensis]
MINEQFIAAIGQYASIFVIVLTRIAATFSALIFFKREVFPAKIAVLFSMALTVFILTNHIDKIHIEPGYFPLLFNLIIQLFLGFIVAFIMNLFIEIFLSLGQIISMQSGMGFANLLVPRVGPITPISEFFMITATLIFFELNGHLVLIKMIVESFQTDFLQFNTFNPELFIQILLFAKIIFSGALMLSLSTLIAILLSNITIAVMTKFSPQLNIFTVGINISMLVCFFALYVSFDLILENGKILLNQFLEFVQYVEIHGAKT